MARKPKAGAPPAPAADDFKPVAGFSPIAVLDDEGPVPAAPAPAPVREPVHDLDEPAADPRDAEIARLRGELAALKAEPGALPGGKVTVSWRDGPTLTIAVRPGETPAEALARHGVHSTPHKLEVHPAPDDAALGQHLPGGGVRPFAGG